MMTTTKPIKYFMLSPANAISCLRAPLALLFIIENTAIRTAIIFIAMLTDCIDGYLARRYDHASRFGAILDPIMDKFFVYTILTVLLIENHLTLWQVGAMLSRDASLFLFFLYLTITHKWKAFEFRAIRWGKITTATQFLTLTALVLHIDIPNPFYLIFVLFGCLAFVELITCAKHLSTRQSNRV